MSSHPDVLVVGAGLVGLCVAWRAALDGAQVTLVDPAPASAASHVAAGMLAPVTEAHYGEEPLLALTLAAAQRYPSFVAELQEATGLDAGYRTTGTLAVALDADDKAELGELAAFHARLGLDSTPLTSREVRRHEPMLAPGVRGGLLVTGDHSVDNRRLAAALLSACAAAGVRVVPARVAALVVEGDRATGVRLADATVLAAGRVVLAAGPWSGLLDGVPETVRPAVRPVKGHVLRLVGAPGLLARTVRAVVQGTQVYLVPRADGEVVVGATVEERGFDTSVQAGGVYQLLRDATLLLPGVAEMELRESSAGLRPGSPDNAPLLGATALPGLHLATGHHRNGVLLAPLTGDLLAAELRDGVLPELARPFGPERFAVGVPA